jgi:hypothetical protein
VVLAERNADWQPTSAIVARPDEPMPTVKEGNAVLVVEHDERHKNFAELPICHVGHALIPPLPAANRQVIVDIKRPGGVHRPDIDP